MAAKNTSVALGAPFVEFARRKVESGEFGTTSEVVREAMRKFMHEDAERQRLLALIDEGLASPIVPFDPRSWLEQRFPDE